MKRLLTYIFVLLFNFMLVRGSFTVQKVQRAKSQILKMFPNGTIPGGMPEWVAVLDDSMHLLHNCLPTIKSGRCYHSRVCKVPELKLDGRMLPFRLKFCKKPYQIVIEFLRFKIPWWAKVDLKPVIINFSHQSHDGVFTIHSRTTIKARVRLIRLRILKASFYVDGILRYDCTKPRHDWRKRVAYNLKAPNKQYTSIFYKLRMRIEIKRKSFSWFRFKWKCKKCKDIVNKSGSFGSGRPSCVADMQRAKFCRSYRYHRNTIRQFCSRCGKQENFDYYYRYCVSHPPPGADFPVYPWFVWG